MVQVEHRGLLWSWLGVFASHWTLFPKHGRGGVDLSATPKILLRPAVLWERVHRTTASAGVEMEQQHKDPPQQGCRTIQVEASFIDPIAQDQNPQKPKWPKAVPSVLH